MDWALTSSAADCADDETDWALEVASSLTVAAAWPAIFLDLGDGVQCGKRFPRLTGSTLRGVRSLGTASPCPATHTFWPRWAQQVYVSSGPGNR